MARKTIDVQAVKDRSNYMLTVLVTPEARMGVSTLLESILFTTDNYNGFRYLPSELNEDGSLKEDYDTTQRQYY